MEAELAQRFLSELKFLREEQSRLTGLVSSVKEQHDHHHAWVREKICNLESAAHSKHVAQSSATTTSTRGRGLSHAASFAFRSRRSTDEGNIRRRTTSSDGGQDGILPQAKGSFEASLASPFANEGYQQQVEPSSTGYNSPSLSPGAFGSSGTGRAASAGGLEHARASSFIDNPLFHVQLAEPIHIPDLPRPMPSLPPIPPQAHANPASNSTASPMHAAPLEVSATLPHHKGSRDMDQANDDRAGSGMLRGGSTGLDSRPGDATPTLSRANSKGQSSMHLRSHGGSMIEYSALGRPNLAGRPDSHSTPGAQLGSLGLFSSLGPFGEHEENRRLSMNLAFGTGQERGQAPSLARCSSSSHKYMDNIPQRLLQAYNAQPAPSRLGSRRPSLSGGNEQGGAPFARLSVTRNNIAAQAGAFDASNPEHRSAGRTLNMSLARASYVSSGLYSPRGREGAWTLAGRTPSDIMYDANMKLEPMLGDEEDPDRLPRPLREWLQLYLWGIIRPEGRTGWDLTIMLLLVWVCFASPFIICFNLGGGYWPITTLGTVELIVDIAFIVDMYLNFRTAYYDSHGNLVFSRRAIALMYLRTWFLLDLVSVIPFDVVTSGTFGFLSMLKLLRAVRIGKVLNMLKALRLLRLVRLPRILQRVERHLDKGFLQIAMGVLAVALLVHLSACIFWYMAQLHFHAYGTWEGTWVGAYGLDTDNLGENYLSALYWSCTTAATVGYGDITPKQPPEEVVAILVMIAGVALVGYVTSTITSIMGIRNTAQTAVLIKKQVVSDILKQRQVPDDLARHIYNFFNYESSKLIRHDEDKLLQELPFKLRSRMLYHMYSDIIGRMPVLSQLRLDVLIDVINHLKLGFYADGDIVVLQGDYASCMSFVAEGALEVRSYSFGPETDPWKIFEACNKSEFTNYTYIRQGKLRKSYYFGHASTVHGGVWPATVVTRGSVQLYSLDLAAIKELADTHECLALLLDVEQPPQPSVDTSELTLELLQMPPNPLALAADFPIIDPPPRKVGNALTSAMKGLVGGIGAGITHMVDGIGSIVAGPGGDAGAQASGSAGLGFRPRGRSIDRHVEGTFASGEANTMRQEHRGGSSSGSGRAAYSGSGSTQAVNSMAGDAQAGRPALGAWSAGSRQTGRGPGLGGTFGSTLELAPGSPLHGGGVAGYEGGAVTESTALLGQAGACSDGKNTDGVAWEV